MSHDPPKLNSDKTNLWDSDRSTAKDEIFRWLAENAVGFEKRPQLEADVRKKLKIASQHQSLEQAISGDIELLPILRALTKRDVGIAQMALYLDIGITTYEKMENGLLTNMSSLKGTTISSLLEKVATQLSLELDYGIVGWLSNSNFGNPTDSEIDRCAIIAADRILKRRASTILRYEHEPRQLKRLTAYLNNLGFNEIPGKNIVDPVNDMPQGTYSFRVNVEGEMVQGGRLRQSVDVLVKPHSKSKKILPIFIEAKSMTDEVNPNKRQKEEAQKVDNMRRRWAGSGHALNFLLLFSLLRVQQ